MAAPGPLAVSTLPSRTTFFILDDVGPSLVELPVDVLGRVGRDVLVLDSPAFARTMGAAQMAATVCPLHSFSLPDE